MADEYSILDDDDDDDGDTVGGWLVVNEPCKDPAELNVIEADYRRYGCPPLQFLEQEGNDSLTETTDAPYVLANAAEFAELMGLKPGTPVTPEQADEWIKRWTVNGRWMYWQGRCK